MNNTNAPLVKSKAEMRVGFLTSETVWAFRVTSESRTAFTEAICEDLLDAWYISCPSPGIGDRFFPSAARPSVRIDEEPVHVFESQ
jgi:hypothetical protein